MDAALVPHALRVRTKEGTALAVAVRHIYRFELARRAGELLAEFLAEPTDEFTAAARWAFAIRDDLEAAGVELRTCVVEVARGRKEKGRPRGQGGRLRWQTVARFAVGDVPRRAAG